MTGSVYKRWWRNYDDVIKWKHIPRFQAFCTRLPEIDHPVKTCIIISIASLRQTLYSVTRDKPPREDLYFNFNRLAAPNYVLGYQR